MRSLLNLLYFSYPQLPLQNIDQENALAVSHLQNKPLLSISPEWHLLGPFQIGTREATWGADPLEAYGGFHTLKYDPHAVFRSSLVPNGTLSWSNLTVIENRSSISSSDSSTESTTANFTIAFPDVDWLALQSIYGWAALQYTVWARGSFYIHADECTGVVISAAPTLEVWVDEQHSFGGDLYGFRKAGLVRRLSPGEHTLELRLARDVRAMGGVGAPEIRVELGLEMPKTPIALVKGSVIIADVIGTGGLASPHASFAVRNNGGSWITISSIKSHGTHSLNMPAHVKIAPGQTRPVSFTISLGQPDILLVLLVEYSESSSELQSLDIEIKLQQSRISEPHKYTFLHPSGIVSYAMIRPPSLEVSRQYAHTSKLPILLNLHGAGLKADDPQLTHSLDDVSVLPVWTIFPSGVTPWSGDDWHEWGWADVEAAIYAIRDWIEATAWTGPGVDLDRWIVAGHSNGGQGTWYALTHRPDKVFAAAAISGYLSIQAYVPFQLWREVDPRLTGIIQASLSNYRHEALISNAKGIPIFQQHGGADDNVPPYHSRRMNQLICEADWTSEYHEVPGEGHWFDGIMTTTPLRRFYEEQVKERSARRQNFTLTVANPRQTGPKNGVLIEQVLVPGQLAKLKVGWVGNVLSIRTSNIQRLALLSWNSSNVLCIDGQTLSVATTGQYQRDLQGSWQVFSHDKSSTVCNNRSTNQLGNINAILNTQWHFLITYHDQSESDLAVQISRNLFQYFSADSEIINLQGKTQSKTNGSIHVPDQEGNIISLSTGSNISFSSCDSFPIQLLSNGIKIRDEVGLEHFYAVEHDGLAAVFLRPLEHDRLELVIWGSTHDSLAVAARLVPMLTGVGQPEFLIVTKESKLKGLEGVVAMGSFDSQWNMSKASFFL